MRTSFYFCYYFCACSKTIRSRFHYFSMAFVRVHLCVCVCAHALNLMKGILCSSQSQVIFPDTHTHTDTHTPTHTHCSYRCHSVYAHRDTIYTEVMLALKRPHMYSHSDVCRCVYMSTQSKSAKAFVHARSATTSCSSSV